jgi:predicted ATPase
MGAEGAGATTGGRRQQPRHFERVEWAPHGDVDLERWPFTIPAVAQLVRDGGLEIPPGVTFLVGENGSGKSTIVEALAEVYPRQGALATYGHITGPAATPEDSPLPRHLRARTHPLASPHGFFLRAERMHAYLAEVDADPTQRRGWHGERLQERSHGESFLTVLRHRFNEIGVYFLDEPEAALSFRSVLGLIALLDLLRQEGSQVVVATHSPVLTSLPAATLLELGDWGMRPATYDELEVVRDWREFLESPRRWLRHLVHEVGEE